MKYHFRVHKEGRGYWAECVELKGCVTQGHSLKNLEKNMAEALHLYLDEPSDSSLIFPLPKKTLRAPNLVTVLVEPRAAFSFYLRNLRLQRGLTQKQVAEKMGFKNIYSYQRLESSKTANPELATIVEIKKIFPEFSVDDLISAS
ncbi:MAG: helix-turn-helix domain-containing protein [Bdellovibrionales bacterium]